jgi:hypothetical protein
MAFNVGKFVKAAGKTAANRMLNDVVTSATSKLPLSTSLAARSTIDSLFNVGASYESISAFATQRTDSLINDNAEMYFALAGKDPARAAAADIERLRHSGIDQNTNYFIEEINPSTKIRNKKREASGAIHTTQPFVELP